MVDVLLRGPLPYKKFPYMPTVSLTTRSGSVCNSDQRFRELIEWRKRRPWFLHRYKRRCVLAMRWKAGSAQKKKKKKRTLGIHAVRHCTSPPSPAGGFCSCARQGNEQLTFKRAEIAIWKTGSYSEQNGFLPFFWSSTDCLPVSCTPCAPNVSHICYTKSWVRLDPCAVLKSGSLHIQHRWTMKWESASYLVDVVDLLWRRQGEKCCWTAVPTKKTWEEWFFFFFLKGRKITGTYVRVPLLCACGGSQS